MNSTLENGYVSQMRLWIAPLTSGQAAPALADAYQTASNAHDFKEMAAACGGEVLPGVDPAMVIARKDDRAGYERGIEAGRLSWKDLLSKMSLKVA